MFIKLTRDFGNSSFYINVNMIETINRKAKGSLVKTVNDAGRAPDSCTSIGHFVKETPEQIIEMIKEIEK